MRLGGLWAYARTADIGFSLHLAEFGFTDGPRPRRVVESSVKYQNSARLVLPLKSK